LFVKVAVPRPLEATFDYLYNEESFGPIEAGDWVRVPFGKGRLNACVISVSREAPALPEGVRIREVEARLDSSFRVQPEIMKLCVFGAEYYQYPLGEALASAIPPKIEKPIKTRSGKARSVAHAPRTLSAEQRTVSESLDRIRSESPGSVFLLEGVTGSGKTEVYIDQVRKVLEAGGAALVLVPEIALTAQLRERFESGLGVPAALWHSALPDGQRQDLWRRVRQGEIRVVIGARSAVFAPLQNLGIIIVDEEHDPTYKQEDRFRYQGRDLALFRGKFSKAAVILGSATPSLETLQRVKEGKIHHLKLVQRYSEHQLPAIHLVSLVEESPVGAGTVKTHLAETTIRAVQETLDRGEQVILFLNRRGFSQFLLCPSCGEVKKCDQCSISMTHYQRRPHLKCHVCGAKEPVPKLCHSCGTGEWMGMGSGTESLEEDLGMVLTGARILRLDRDLITSQQRLEETLDEFRAGRANVLIGTQMLVKGHDFPGVTCVVVISADMLLKWPDFRASERALQTLIQVSGRAGRGTLPGRVYIQGYDLEHPVIRVLTGELDRGDFLNEELAMRELLAYPPFSRLVRFRFESKEEAASREAARGAAEELRRLLPEEFRTRLLGPSEALLPRANGQYRFDLYFKSPGVELLYRAGQAVRAWIGEQEVDLIVDVDPYHS
jgi:primosomal protein N' (replication factor Y)